MTRRPPATPALRKVASFTLAASLIAGGALAEAASPAAPDECVRGIANALGGNLALAESVFVSMLSRSPHDPRALNNLGNLALLRGRAEVALAFYELASARDTTDAGIVLNQATALMVLGGEDEARDLATAGVTSAGGLRAAAGLLGLTAVAETGSSPASKAGSRPRVTQEEMMRLLKVAAGKVPMDSIRSSPEIRRLRARPPILRAAGPRGDPGADAPMIVYWRR